MDTCHLSDKQRHSYQVNAAALREYQPEVAGKLDEVAITPSVEPVAGRDGTDTCLLRHEDGSFHWLGRSSMPTVSARAMLAGFNSPGRNVILPGIGTGHEAPIIAGKSPPHCAVLAWEPDVLSLKLALHQQDISRLIRQGRVLLMCGDDLAEALADLFRLRPGLEFPTQILPLPGHTAAQQDRTKLVVEAAARRVGSVQAEALAGLAGELGRRIEFSLSGLPRVAVLSQDPRPDTITAAGGIAGALDHLGWPAGCSVPDRPESCHILSRLQLVRDHEPDLVLLLNCTKGPLSAFLPARQPTCSWLINSDSVGTVPPEGLAADGHIFVAQPEMIQNLAEAGARPEQVHLLERATDPATYDPDRLASADRQELSSQVAVLADGCDLGPGAMGITLASHVRLWEALCRLAGEALDGWTDRRADQLLKDAERKTGAGLDDQNLRARFLFLIRSRVVPTLAALAAVERLARSGLDVGLWGTGWESHPRVRPLARSLGAASDERVAVLGGGRVVVCPYFAEHAVQAILDCVAAGGCPVFTKPGVPLAELHPQLHGVFERVPCAASPADLADVVSRAVADEEFRRSAIAEVRQEVLQHHTYASRLTTIRETILRG